MVVGKCRDTMIIQTWRRCIVGQEAAPAGCFIVYVGPGKERFSVKTEFANHPLFKVLLKDAALEYGYRNDGPILLPCDVDLFSQVLAEMESMEDENVIGPDCCLLRIFFGPLRLRHDSNSRLMEEDCAGGAYRLLVSPVQLNGHVNC